MFRSKKSAGNGADNGSDVTQPTAVVTAPPPEPQELKVPVRRTPPPVIRPLPPASSPLELTRRPGEVVGASARSETSASPARDKTLIVGKDVEFSGDIKACQKLIVEGLVQVNSSDCRLLQVGPTGVFRGRIEVTEAEILGRFEGELVVHDRLVIRATGQATGKIRYGTIVIDAGGQVAGEVSALERKAANHTAGESGADVFTIPGASVGSTAAAS